MDAGGVLVARALGDACAPQRVAALSLPGAYRARLRSDGRFLAGAELQGAPSSQYRFWLYEIESFTPVAHEVTALPDVLVTFPLAAPLQQPVSSPQQLSVAFLGSDRVVLAFPHRQDAASEIDIVDRADALNPRVSAQRVIEELTIDDVLGAGTTIVAMAHVGDSHAPSDRLCVFSIESTAGEQTIEPGACLVTEGAAGISALLAFDGTTALVARPDNGVEFIDVGGTVPVSLGFLDTAEQVLSAVFAQDHLVLGSRSTIEVVAPPCPAP